MERLIREIQALKNPLPPEAGHHSSLVTGKLREAWMVPRGLHLAVACEEVIDESPSLSNQIKATEDILKCSARLVEFFDYLAEFNHV